MNRPVDEPKNVANKIQPSLKTRVMAVIVSIYILPPTKLSAVTKVIAC